MADRAFQDGLDKVRRIPERVLLVVCAGIVHVPVACPQLVVWRTRHFRVSKSSRSPWAAFKKQMTDSGPSYGESMVFEDPQNVRNVLPLSSSLLADYLFRMMSKSPTELKIRRDTCCSFGIVFER